MIVTSPQNILCDWASIQFIGRIGLFDPADKDVAIGWKKDGKLVCVVIYNNYQVDYNLEPKSIEMSVISIDKRCFNRHNLSVFFGYPFIQLGLKRIQVSCSVNNKGSIMFAKKLGFIEEGRHRQAGFDGSDTISLSLLKDECKWLA